MLQASKPVLIGSVAADIGGFLPPHRLGKTNDIDLVCTRDQAYDISTKMNIPLKEHSEGRAVLLNQFIRIDLDFQDNERTELVRKLSTTPVRLYTMSTDAYIAPLEVIWATVVYTVGLNKCSTDKAAQDCAYYDSLAKNINNDHLKLAELYRQVGLNSLIGRINGNRRP